MRSSVFVVGFCFSDRKLFGDILSDNWKKYANVLAETEIFCLNTWKLVESLSGNVEGKNQKPLLQGPRHTAKKSEYQLFIIL
jgi:hypothetical protein